MKLTVIGSSSHGNGYILQNDREALILEAGVHYNDVRRALGYNVKKVAGCLITHEHGDHAGHVNEYLQGAVKIYASAGTIDSLDLKGPRKPTAIEPGRPFSVGSFKVIAFDTKHDAAQPFGYYINHPETGNILFATDTYYLPCTFRNLNNILIECNYSAELLNESIAAGSVPAAIRARTLKSHLSYNNCKAALQANDLTGVNNIVLIHLSGNNADPAAFASGIQEATGKTTTIASPGLEIEFNATPF